MGRSLQNFKSSIFHLQYAYNKKINLCILIPVGQVWRWPDVKKPETCSLINSVHLFRHQWKVVSNWKPLLYLIFHTIKSKLKNLKDKLYNPPNSTILSWKLSYWNLKDKLYNPPNSIILSWKLCHWNLKDKLYNPPTLLFWAENSATGILKTNCTILQLYYSELKTLLLES